jgi:acyl-CoA thioesterase I
MNVDRLSRLGRRLWLKHFNALLCTALLPPALRAQPKQTKVLVLGDSLSAEYGLARGSGWVALIEKRLANEKLAITVVNASISGDTTSGGRSRLGALLLQHGPQLVLIELGGNDALRGLPLAMTQDNLTEMVRACHAAGAKVVVAGMQMPPNYGRKYGEDFAALFAKVSKAQGAALVPFLLKGVADGPDAEQLFQADRIHPTAQAHPRIADNVWAVLRPLLGPAMAPLTPASKRP